MDNRKELLDYCKAIDDRVRKNGSSYNACEGRFKASQILYDNGFKDDAFNQIMLAKNELYGIVKKATKSISVDGRGLDIFEYHDYCRERGVDTNEMRLFWEMVLFEAPHKFDSFLLYLEKDRQEKDRFYLPKRTQFRKFGIIDALQDLEDDKLNLVTISMPPGTQKCQPLYSKVLTPNGFIEMRDVNIGTKVIAGNGKEANVIGVSPIKRRKIYEITLGNGAKCRCSDNHLWKIMRIDKLSRCAEEYLLELNDILDDYENCYIPCGELHHWMKITNIEFIEIDDCKCIMIDDPCHLYFTDDYIITHNTTTEKFFATWVFGRHPDDYSLFYSHSNDITRMFYDGVLDICTNSVEYRYKDIFPWMILDSTNAKAETINFNGFKPFANLQCTSVGAKNAGKVRCNRYLYCDDLIGGIEEAMSKDRLDALWSKYSVDARQRKLNEQVKEIHIATRWSVHDVIGRLQTIYLGDNRARFISIPDIDPKTGRSNFNYKFNGMSETFFHDQELLMDDISYRCLYKNEPIEREGILYHADELRRYTSLPDGEPDAILSVCDTKAKGSDFMVMPIVYQYGEDYYLVDCVCDDSSDYGVQYEKLASRLYRNNVQQCEFESNSGGDRVAFEVQKRIDAMGGRCNITSKATETNKETRIIVNADWVKKNVLFKDESMYTLKEDYGNLVSWLCRYSLVGKNPHDDVPDAMANLSLFISRKFKKSGASAVFNPFRMRTSY